MQIPIYQHLPWLLLRLPKDKPSKESLFCHNKYFSLEDNGEENQIFSLLGTSASIKITINNLLE